LQPEELIFKIRENLIEQKKRLQDYLNILDSENTDIAEKNVDKLHAHISIEKKIVEELESFKKILAPMELIYYSSPYKKDTVIKALTESINKLAGSVKEKSVVNIDQLNGVMEKIKAEVNSIERKKMADRTGYNTVESMLVDISG